MVGVQQWAEVRRLRFVRGLSIREISRRTGLHRETIRRAITNDEPPKYSREGRGSKLDFAWLPGAKRMVADGSGTRRSTDGCCVDPTGRDLGVCSSDALGAP